VEKIWALEMRLMPAMSTMEGTNTMLEPSAKLVTSPPPMVDMHTVVGVYGVSNCPTYTNQ
jgi:hypothetical protein